jgi:hypothetical protein
MIFKKYYEWIQLEMRADGNAFLRSIEKTQTEVEKIERVEKEASNADEVCTNIVPLAVYRDKKRA